MNFSARDLNFLWTSNVRVYTALAVSNHDKIVIVWPSLYLARAFHFSAFSHEKTSKVVVKPILGRVRTACFQVDDGNRLAASCAIRYDSCCFYDTIVVPTRLVQAVRNKSVRACCHQLVNNLLRADDIRLVGTTCCKSVGFINFVTRW
jgi:hypothetical protein